MATKSIKVFDIMGKETAVLPKDGELLFREIILTITTNAKSTVEVDFSQMKYVTSAFLNASIGKLLLKHPEYKGILKYKSLPKQELIVRINRVVNMATDATLRAAHDRAIEEVLN